MRSQILSLCAVATMATATTASGALIADYRLDGGTHGVTATVEQVVDSAGPLFSNATTTDNNSPVWWTDMGDLPNVPNNPNLGAPANGVALRMTQDAGFHFGQGANNELADALQGPFTVFARVLKLGGNQQMRLLHKAGTVAFQLETSSNAVSLAAYVVTDAGSHSVKSSVTATGARDNWMDVAMTYDPGASLRIFVNGAQVNENLNVPGQIGNDANSPVRFANAAVGDEHVSYLESLRIYDHALSSSEVAALSIPEPASLSVLGIGAAGLLARRRRGATG